MEQLRYTPEQEVEAPNPIARGYLRLVVNNEREFSASEMVEAILQKPPTVENVQFVLHAVQRAAS